MSGPNVKQAVPMFNVVDLPRSLRFYVDGLGFRMTHQWVPDGVLRWCMLEHGEAKMMLQSYWTDGPHYNVPATPVGIGVSINFLCEDAIALWREFVSRGIDAGRPFVGNGMWVTSVTDPDGYALTFESVTDTEEETVLEE